MIRKMQEGTDSTEDRAAATTEQKEAKTGDNSVAQVPEVVGETVEVDADATSAATNTDKTATKTGASTSSSEEVDEEQEGDEKVGKDGKGNEVFAISN